MKFFDINGVEIDKSKFITLYRDSYYLDKDQYVPGLSRCSRFVEDKIDNLLKNGIQSELNVVHILAWKIGKIKHGDSEKCRKFVYADDWVNAEKLAKVTRYGREFDIETIAKYIADPDHIKTLEDKAVRDPQGVLCDLKNCEVKGLGSVYLITLLYFISRGTYPIYDRFAMMAIDAIIADIKPGNEVEYHTLPDKSSKKKFNAIMQEHMVPYIQKLNEVFGDEYHKSRDIDRALWVYGHLFIGTKKN